ncbi:cytochrome c3 family protein [bacterium]|nr:cytochrome c3 family protein [bacterium]
MTTRRTTLGIVGGIGLGCWLLLQPASLRAAEEPAADAAAAGPAAGTLPEAAAPAVEPLPLTNWLIYIAVPEAFTELKRAPVKFDHDRHTATLGGEGCDGCHPKNDKGEVLFTFPKVRDEADADSLMNSFHQACIGCHKERAAEAKKAGPTDCGDCHVIERQSAPAEYHPVLPDYYEVLRDTYHRNCMACHGESEEHAAQARALDWKSFYLRQRQLVEQTWPPVVFDYALHDKHDKALPKKCELCHYLSPAKRQELEAEGKEPTNRDWLREIDEASDFAKKEVAHARCLNCHLERRAQKQTRGPLYCANCHNGRERSLAELAQAPRLDCEQKDRILIEIKEGTRAKAVPFDHQSHQGRGRSCQECHHQTLRACRECHTLEGAEEGDHITLAEAYHDGSSTWSCVGCHAAEKKKPDCAGCHHRLPGGLVASACGTCHSGSLTNLETIAKLPAPAELLPRDLKEKLEIGVITNEYQVSKMPHLAIANRLTELVNSNQLARYFHPDPMTVCAGCHHYSPLEKQVSTPACRTCHTVRPEPETATPTLLGAYHQQCIGCHQQMGETEKKMPRRCAGCHEEKEKG